MADTRTHYAYRAAGRTIGIMNLVQLVYAAVFVAKSSFCIEGHRYFCLYDDAMISMRYAANWAAGHGLVWNAGDHVEGYTNFAWTALMGVLHLLPFGPEHLCLLVQVVGALVWCAVPWTTLSLARACRLAPAAALIAAVLTTWQNVLIVYSLMGMETVALAIVLTVALRGVVWSIRRRSAAMHPVFWFALAYLLRMDALLIAVPATLVMLARAERGRVRIVAAVGISSLAVGAHLLWLHDLYGSWLPNTYYLKATGWPLPDRLPVGLRLTLDTLLVLGLPLMLATVSAIQGGLHRWLLLAGVVSMMGYCTWVGGDSSAEYYYRFELPMTPALMVLAAQGIVRSANLLGPLLSTARFRIGLTACTLAAVNLPFLDYILLLRPPRGTISNRTSVLNVIAGERIADDEATAAVMVAGVFPYYSERRCFDILGKNDAHIARLPARPEVQEAGHNKFDVDYTLETYRPDLITWRVVDMGTVFFRDYRPVAVTVDGQVLTLSVRKRSPHITGGRPIGWPESNQILLNTPRY